MTRRFKSSVAVICLSLLGAMAKVASAQPSVGVVTALQGQAQLTRAGAQSGLRFKESLVLRDQVDTSARSLARILFGGKSTVTLRELSRLEVREEALPGGSNRLHHALAGGGVLVHVVRQLLNAGDEVQIQTPNAIAGVRGTTVFARYRPGQAQTEFTVLTGSALVTPLGFAPLALAAGNSVTVTGDSASGIQVGPVRAVTAQEADEILSGSEIAPALKQEAARDDTIRTLGERAGKETLEISSTQCWPYVLCLAQSSLTGTLVNMPVPSGSSVDTGLRGINSIKTSAAPGKGG